MYKFEIRGTCRVEREKNIEKIEGFNGGHQQQKKAIVEATQHLVALLDGRKLNLKQSK